MRRTAQLARRLVEQLGGRYSLELGIEVDGGDEQIERWALLATLFGNRISAAVAARTYRTLAAAGVRTIGEAGGRSWDELVALLDSGGYARYDFRTASRLHELAAVLTASGDGVVAIGKPHRYPAELEAALDALPGWGPVTVRLFLRELRGVWPAARPRVDERTSWSARHLGLPLGADPVAGLRRLGTAAGLDRRDLEVALVRLALAHARDRSCDGGPGCAMLEGPITTRPQNSHARTR